MQDRSAVADRPQNDYQSSSRSGGSSSQDAKAFDKLTERVHALEVAQATQAATLAGAQATQAATQAGTMATNTAAQAGMMATMAAGSIALIVGIFLGLMINRSHDD